jgi:hypothetical protein
MRYIEYVYLLIVVVVGAFITTNFKDMAIHQVILTGLGLCIAAFMYSFRRTQRLMYEKREQEELEEMKKNAGEDGV